MARHTELLDQEADHSFEGDSTRREMDSLKGSANGYNAGLCQSVADLKVRRRVRVFGVPKVVISKNPALRILVNLVLKERLLDLRDYLDPVPAGRIEPARLRPRP